MYELIIVWESVEGEEKVTDVYRCKTIEEAEEKGRGFRKVFGNQIEWLGIRRVTR